jgi:hypothetical protein
MLPAAIEFVTSMAKAISVGRALDAVASAATVRLPSPTKSPNKGSTLPTASTVTASPVQAKLGAPSGMEQSGGLCFCARPPLRPNPGCRQRSRVDRIFQFRPPHQAVGEVYRRAIGRQERRRHDRHLDGDLHLAIEEKAANKAMQVHSASPNPSDAHRLFFHADGLCCPESYA